MDENKNDKMETDESKEEKLEEYEEKRRANN